jgi:hypothetical protein
MADPEPRSGEELIDDSGRNPTQREIDEGGPEATEVDAGWGDADETASGSEEEVGDDLAPGAAVPEDAA